MGHGGRLEEAACAGPTGQGELLDHCLAGLLLGARGLADSHSPKSVSGYRGEVEDGDPPWGHKLTWCAEEGDLLPGGY
ncbi:hypothetical protein NDU88_005218 [Pleurodeles waltl]|uniref:Uncharacterized protein n=1 Tax=Pleurodeles waltl TaxID=8319 RepID=A0AAV7TU71_PLEWA|nr:hypothetical protein NDU88_005218 [Pleurodeles waltl]